MKDKKFFVGGIQYFNPLKIYIHGDVCRRWPDYTLFRYDGVSGRWIEMPECFQEKLGGIDPEAWREEYRAKQAAGVKFEVRMMDGKWLQTWCGFNGHKDNYREVPQRIMLVANILRRNGKLNKVQEWKFFGTPEEYRAECEKYGYALLSEIKEVDKPKTVKHYFCMFKDCNGRIDAFAASSTERLQDLIKRVGCTIIGDIEEREVDA